MLVQHSSPWTVTGYLMHPNIVIVHFMQCFSGWDVLPAIQCELATTVIQRADIYYTLNRYIIEVILYIIASRRYMQKYNPWKQAQRTCTVETLYSTIYYSKYFIELHIDKSTQYVALWTYKRHPIPRPFGRAMECLLWVLQQKLIVL